LQQQHLKWLSNRTLSLSFGRGLLMYQTQVAQSTEKVNIPEIFLSAKISPLNSLVEYDVSNSDSNFKEWPDFHNGVASGLSIRESNPIIDSSWISFNQIIPTDDSISSSNSKHAGFLFGLGLNGYLKALNALDVYSYLISKDSIISIGLSLGLAASYIGSKDISIMKLLSIHIQGLLPPNAAPLNISIMTQSVSLLSLGWVFEGSMNRNLAECSLKELLTQGKDEMYTLSCGITLVINLL
jgi:anaphase-promoting complex subunit 1